MARDDFSEDTKLRLAKRAGFRCSFSGCRGYTVGPSNESPSAVVCVGIAAHIAAAAPGGRRFDASMSGAERSSIENGLWLCATHATLIDRDDSRYTAAALRQMKASHEALIQQRVDGESEEPPTDPLAQRISGTAQAILRAMNDFWEHELLAQVLRDELAAHTDLARDARYGVTLCRRQVDQQELVAVAQEFLAQALAFTETITRLFGEPLKDAVGPAGVAGDPQSICYIASRTTEVYRSALEWGLSWRSLECDWAEAQGFIELMPQFLGNVAAAIERLPTDIQDQVRAARDYIGDTPMSFEVTLTMDIPDHLQQRLDVELERMTAKRKTQRGWALLERITDTLRGR